LEDFFFFAIFSPHASRRAVRAFISEKPGANKKGFDGTNEKKKSSVSVELFRFILLDLVYLSFHIKLFYFFSEKFRLEKFCLATFFLELAEKSSLFIPASRLFNDGTVTEDI